MKEKKKKILFLHVALVIGGAETVLVNYLNMLAKHPDYDVELLVFEGMEKYNLEKIDTRVKIVFLLNDIETQFNRCSYAFSNKEYILQGDKNYFKSWNDYTNNVRLQRLVDKIEKGNYDVVVDFLATSIAFITKEFLEKIKPPILYWIHSDADFNKWLSNKEEYRKRLSYIDTFVSICSDMEKKCNDILLNDLSLNKKYCMLYNPVDIHRVYNLSNDSISEQDSILLNEPFILQVARLFEHQKNHLRMIEIFGQLKKKGIREKLYIIGGGHSYDILKSRIKELGLEKDCLLLGQRINPIPFMKKAKLFIHTANYEGLPTVFIESMMCGTPVVAFDCPTGPREILSDGKYGGLIPMENTQLFIDKTFELLTDEEKRQYYISLLPEAVERFSFDKIESELLSLIDNVIEKNGTKNEQTK